MGGSDPGKWAAASPDLNYHVSIFSGRVKVNVHSVKIRDSNPPRQCLTDAGVIDEHSVLPTGLVTLNYVLLPTRDNTLNLC